MTTYFNLGTETGMSGDEIASGVSWTNFNSKVFGGYSGTPNLSEYNIVQDDNAVPVIEYPQTTGHVLVGPEDYSKFQLQSSRAEYISVLSGYRVSSSPAGCGVQTVRSFYFNGDVIAPLFRYIRGWCLVFVDGKMFSSFSLVSALNTPKFFTLNLGSAKLRRIDIVGTVELWGGFAHDPSYSVYPTRDNKPSFAVLGDSYTAGTGATEGLPFVAVMRQKLGCMDIANFGIGGSGYINDTSSGKFVNRIQETKDAGFDYLVVVGGINDNAESVVDFTVAVDDFYSSALNIYGDASKIIIVSNQASGTAALGSITEQFRDILKAKASEIGSLFIDSIGDLTSTSWIFGSGRVSSETGDGNADVMTSSDGTHPSDDGHLMYGTNIALGILKGSAVL